MVFSQHGIFSAWYFQHMSHPQKSVRVKLYMIVMEFSIVVPIFLGHAASCFRASWHNMGGLVSSDNEKSVCTKCKIVIRLHIKVGKHVLSHPKDPNCIC